MRTATLLTLFLSLWVGITGQVSGDWASVYLQPASWTANPDLVPQERRADNYEVRPDGPGLVFRSRGPLVRTRSMKWTAPLTAERLWTESLVFLRYRAEGLAREQNRQEVLSIAPASGQSSTPLVYLADLVSDGRPHTLVVKKKINSGGTKLVVTVDSRESEGYLAIESILFSDWISEIPLSGPPQAEQAKGSFRAIDIARQCNGNYEEVLHRLLHRPGEERISDALTVLGPGEMSLAGIPFTISAGRDNLILAGPEPGANQEIIDNFGLRVRRGLVAPISRDVTETVKIGGPASEIYFLGVAELPARRHYYATPDTPYSLDDAETFAAEVVYEGGRRDLVFPFSLLDGRRTIQRSVGVYAVPTGKVPVDTLVFHNRALGSSVHIAGVTVNTGAPLFPSLTQPPAVPDAPARPLGASARSTTIEKQADGSYRVSNRFFDLELAVDPLPIIRRASNRWADASALAITSAPLLDISKGSVSLDARNVRLINAGLQETAGGRNLLLEYQSNQPDFPLKFTISVGVSDQPEADFGLRLLNTGNQMEQVRVRFPVLRDLRIGQVEDTWYFFPQYLNALSSRLAAFDQQFSFSFPMQFYDIFNPRLGAGVYILTKERNHVMRRYGLAKTASGVTARIEYPKDYTQLKPGEWFNCSPTALGFHSGDWHGAAGAYRDWVKTWYRPVKARNKQWFREAFWLLAEIADGMDDEMYRLPAWYDEGSRQHRMRSILEEHKKLVGSFPDILHFWTWAYSPTSIQRWGAYDEEDYAKMGGRENFRKALDDIQQNLKIPVSLYINANLCTASTPVFQRLGPGKAMLMENGKPRRWNADTYTMCHATDEWIDYLIGVYKRVYREMAAPILYVDQVASVSQQCWSTEHGHESPANMNKADHKLITAIREAMPEEVVLYGEFPLVDVTAPYFDCAINYYFLSLGDQRFALSYDQPAADLGYSPPYLNVYRFIFPSVVQLDLPLGVRHGSWHPLKFIFFNGESIYDSFWDRDETKATEFTARAYNIKKHYADCFTSDTPEMLVPTSQTGIFANRFPGQKRTLWTIYNGRYSTSRGPALSVEHQAGAEYWDLWNDRRLSPRIESGRAIIELEMEPQSIGCVLQRMP